MTVSFWQGQKDLVSPPGSVGASASQRSPPETRAPRHAPHASDSQNHLLYKKENSHLLMTVSFWQGQKDLNPRHAVLETAALPTELYPYMLFYGGPSGTRTPDQPVMSRLL